MKIVTLEEFRWLPGEVMYMRIPKTVFNNTEEISIFDVQPFEIAVRLKSPSTDWWWVVHPFYGTLKNFSAVTTETEKHEFLTGKRDKLVYCAAARQESDPEDEYMYMVLEPIELQTIFHRLLVQFPKETTAAINALAAVKDRQRSSH